MRRIFYFFITLAAFALGLTSSAQAQGDVTSPDCLSHTEHNHTLIILREGGNLTHGTILRAYDPDGICVGETAIEDGNAAIALWGEDSINPQGGLLPGEPFRIVAIVDGQEVPVTYAIQSGPSVYMPNGISTASAFTAVQPGEITVGFREPSGTVRGAFQREIDISGAFGAIILEVRGEGAELSSISVSPDAAVAETYVSDSLLAVAMAMPGEGAYVVSVGAIPSADAGGLTISSVQAVDSSGNIVQVTLSEGESTYTFLILGDVDGDGSVTVADLSEVFLHLIGVDRLEQAERQRADVAPFPGGNQSINIQDFFVLARAVVRGRWPDSAAL